MSCSLCKFQFHFDDKKQMKVTHHIENAKGKPLFSFEIVPPQKGKNIEDLYDNIDPLMEFKPQFIDVTTSREEYIYIDKEWII